jgi:putative ABC transport system permease protein
MINIRWFKVLNDLAGNKTRTLLIVLSMAVGLFAVGVILSARSILSLGLAESFAAINPSSGVVRTGETFDEKFLESVRSMRNVQAADARRNLAARIEIAPDEWKNISIFVVPDYNQIQVNRIEPDSGAWPPPDREILIERAALQVIHAQVGDVVRIKLANDTIREMKIAGTAFDPAQMPAQLDGTPYGYVSFETLDWLGEPFGFNELYVITTHPEDKSWSSQVVNLVKDKSERSGLTIPMTMTAEPGQLPMDDILQAILALMGILGILSLSLSIFLVVNTVSALLAQQKRQIGVMKAVGGSSIQLLGMYLVMVMAYGAFALLLAIPLGIYGARALSQSMAFYFNFDLASMDIPRQSILLQVIVGLALPVLASLVPFITSLRISPAEAMSLYRTGKGRFGANPVDRLISGRNLWFARDIPARSFLLSLRNTFRSKGRLLLTLITLTLGSATFISVFSVRSSLTSTVDEMMKWFNFDVMITFDRSYRSEELQQLARQIPGVLETDTWQQLTVRRVRPDGTEGSMIYMFAPSPESKLISSPGLAAGRWLLPSDQNAVVVSSALFIEEPDLKLGDDIVLKLYGEEHTFKIIGVSIGSSFGTIMYANYDYVSRITDRAGEADALMLTMSARDPEAVISGSSALERFFESNGLRVNTVDTMTVERAQAEAIFDTIVALLLVMAVLMALVGGLGLMGTMSINVLERTREIGILRAIGAPNRGVAQVFIMEGIAIGLLSWLFGALLALPMSEALNVAVGASMMGTPLTYSYSVSGMIIWLVAVFFLSALASYIPARNASRLTVREVLGYE